MNRRSVFFATACLLSALVPALIYAQAKPAAGSAAPPPASAKWVPPQKGEVTVDFWQGKQSNVKGEIVSPIKVKNTSKGSINLLKVEQYWYDKSSKNVAFGEYRHKKAPILPGEVVEFVVVSENSPKINHDALIFGHAYGKLHAREVKKFE